jgi:hypothetical protein
MCRSVASFSVHVFWDVSLCGIIECSSLFGMCRSVASFSIRVFWDVSVPSFRRNTVHSSSWWRNLVFLHGDTASHSRRLESSTTPPLKPQISQFVTLRLFLRQCAGDAWLWKIPFCCPYIQCQIDFRIISPSSWHSTPVAFLLLWVFSRLCRVILVLLQAVLPYELHSFEGCGKVYESASSGWSLRVETCRGFNLLRPSGNFTCDQV